MAASSSSALSPSSSISSLGSFTYEVFLSFRGVDTRQGFTWNLYQSLQNARIETFMDEEDIEAGEEIDERLLKVIEGSRCCVVILSSRYADSKACLMELAAMFRLKKQIIPVFFYVEPSDVSHQSGPFKIDFSTHQKRPFEIAFSIHQKHSSSSRDVEEWRQALTKVGELKEHLVGIDSRVEEVMELLCIGEGGVKMVGIYGMGGVGKTTLAKEIHNRLKGRFEKAIYIECIKDKKDRLPQLHEEFISKVFKDGKKRRVPRERVLVILDDVDHGDQLKALAGGCDWFGEGTRILITTRDVQLLDAHLVHKKYQVHELNSSDSLHLFSRHAFKNDQPSEEFMKISKKIVREAGGLPLALEVLGASLSTELQKEAWEEVETKLRSSGYPEINKCLRISYDGLSQKEQEGFLDIACLFVGQNKDEIIDIWKGCDFGTPVSTVNSLLNKCLLKVDDFGALRMHDLLRDMGRDIGSRSRLWDQKEVWDVLEEHKLLLLENINLKGDFSRMPRSLRSLKWTGCSMQTLPDNFNIQKLGCLKLRNSKIVRFWSDSCISKEKVFTNLKVLDLRNCSALTKLPNFSHSLDLEKLCLQRCSSLTDIPDSIGNLTKLSSLDVSHCKCLSTLPDSIENLPELQELRLNYCKSLSTLPHSIRKLTLLKRLELDSCESLSSLPDFIGNLTELEVLVASYKSLSTLPDSIGNLSRLKYLYLFFCISLSALPDSIGILTKLRTLEMAGCQSLSALPDSIGNLTGLKRIHLSFCKSLPALPYSIGRLTLLEDLQLYKCTSLLALPDSIGNLTGLTMLDLFVCKSLSALPDSIKNLTRLEKLKLRSCTSLSALPPSLGNLTRLKRLKLDYCRSLLALPDSIGNLSQLEKLALHECTSLPTLPDSIGKLNRLGTLKVASCSGLSTLPSSIGSMRRLSTLVLSGSGIEELPDSVRLLESLEWLGIARCRLRSRLPLWEMKRLKGLVIGGEVNQKDESDDGNQNNELFEIPDGITHYSQHSQECRRIRYIETSEVTFDGLEGKVFELSIWAVSGREMKIILLVYPFGNRLREGNIGMGHG
ncbi:disease resistance protein TAO1-like [Nymphaea colorata]|nr:disease resistance protein TAO1-like [Nymphaea colorata]